jgi:hypothetical protein
LQKVTIGFVISVSLHGTTLLPLDRFHEIWCTGIFRKSIKKIQVPLKSNKNNGYFTWRPIYIFDYTHSILLRMRAFQTKVAEKIKTHILYSVTFFRKSCGLWNKWKNIVVPGWPQMTIWHMCILCWIPKAINTHSGYVILTAFPLQQGLHEQTLVLHLYIHCLSCFCWDGICSVHG